jgi:hypothetical protein
MPASRHRRLRSFLVLGAASLSWLAAAAAALAQVPVDEFERGRDLFEGRIEMHGRILTHTTDLPPGVVRCGNCHAVATGPEVRLSLAPRLTHDLLLAPRARRGGPPSIYDRNRFCTLLREGRDPALVIISEEMPRYRLDDTNCWALWKFITGTPLAATSH